MKFLKSVLIISAMFFVFNVSAAPAVTGSNPDWSLYYSFDDVLNYANYSNSIADHSDVVNAFGKYKNLSGSVIYPYSISTTSPFKGRAAALDGTRYIEMGGRYPLYSLGASGNHEITISLWVKFSNSAPNGNDCFIAKNTDAGGDKFLFGIWSSQIMVRINSNYRLQTYVDGTNGSTIDVYDSNWHHFAVAIKEDSANPGTSKVTLWIDGVKRWNNLTISNILSDSDMTTGQIPSIGMDLDGTGLDKTDLLEGYVDELQIFSAVGNDTDAANLYNKRFGVPSDFDVWTSSIEDYFPAGIGGPDLNTPHDNSDGFLYNAYTQMNNNSYGYLNYTVSTFAHVAHDDDVLIGNPLGSGWLTSSSQSSYEVVFHAGHGHSQGIKDYNDDILLPQYYTYSGSTRWVFYDSCSTMKYVAYGKTPCSAIPDPNPKQCCPDDDPGDACHDKPKNEDNTQFIDNEGLNWFGGRFDTTSGPHAIFGFASTMIFYGSSSNGCDWGAAVNNYYPWYRKFDTDPYGSDYCQPGLDNNYVLFNSAFWNDVIRQNTPIWDSYKNAVEQREYDVDIDPISVEATIAYKEYPETGFDGSLEQWSSTYRDEINSSMTLSWKSYVFKKCIEIINGQCNYRLPTYRED